MALTNAAGGLVYHWRAALHARRRWAPFREALAGWLDEWRPSERELILIGPSAGYCIERAFTARFERLFGVEPDPLARRLFVRRHDPRRIEWSGEDFFTPANGDALGRFRRFLDERPGAAVLFCNFLGQLKCVAGRDDARVLEFWKSNLRPALAGRSFASFHDRVSGPLVPHFDQPLKLTQRATDEELLRLCYSGAGSGELLDHEIAGFFDEAQPHAYFAWPLTRGSWQLIEAVKSK